MEIDSYTRYTREFLPLRVKQYLEDRYGISIIRFSNHNGEQIYGVQVSGVTPGLKLLLDLELSQYTIS